jgi:hypothetical protein
MTPAAPGERRCEYCHGTMDGKRPQARTCSDACRQAISRRHRKADQAWAGMSGFGARSPEELYRIRLARSGETEPQTHGPWWTCACGSILALRVTSCPLCATRRPAPRLLDLMAAGLM